MLGLSSLEQVVCFGAGVCLVNVCSVSDLSFCMQIIGSMVRDGAVVEEVDERERFYEEEDDDEDDEDKDEKEEEEEEEKKPSQKERSRFIYKTVNVKTKDGKVHKFPVWSDASDQSIALSAWNFVRDNKIKEKQLKKIVAKAKEYLAEYRASL